MILADDGILTQQFTSCCCRVNADFTAKYGKVSSLQSGVVIFSPDLT